MPQVQHQSANEQRCLSTISPATHGSTSNAYPSSTRRVLADVSPNVQNTTTTPAFMKRALAGSPLKRSFTATIAGGEGLTYLKRRKLGHDELLSDVARRAYHSPTEQSVVPQTDDPTLDIFPSTEDAQSPTEPNSPSDRDDSAQDSSADSKSFSSLINYDPSSQTSTLVFSGCSNAELLRLRLRVAMYKVRTNQIDVPFASLQDEDQVREQQKRKAIDEAVAELRREAQEVMDRAARSNSSKTSASSSTRPALHSQSQRREVIMPSSPPDFKSPDKVSGTVVTVTPLHERWSPTTPRDRTQLHQPPELDLTSSVVKGRVAEGLLGLRNGV